MKPLPPPGRARQKRMVIIIIIITAVLGAGAFFLLIPPEKTYRLTEFETAPVIREDVETLVQGSGEVVLPVQISIPSRQEGYSRTLFVREGDLVTTETVLAVLEVPALEEDLFDSQMNLSDAQRSLELTLTTYRYNHERKIRTIQNARENLEITRQRVSSGDMPQNDLESELQALDELIFELNQMEELHDLAVSSGEAVVEQYRTVMERIKESIFQARITSPIAGEVLSYNSKLSVPGARILQNDTLFTVADRRSALVDLNFEEQYINDLQPGMEVDLSINGTLYPGFIDVVGKIATPSPTGLGSSIKIRITPETGEDLLTPGATVIGEVNLGTRENILTLPRGPYLTTGNNIYLYRVKGQRAERIPVNYGAVQGGKVEIISGVRAGDEIITSGYQNFIQFEEIDLKN
jgi:HlyD family secretion protein